MNFRVVLFLGLIFAAQAEAKSLRCDVTSSVGLYAGGALEVKETADTQVRWIGKDGREELLLGGTKVCGQETAALQYPTYCSTEYTQPAPLKQFLTTCAFPRGAGTARWVGSLRFVMDNKGSWGKVECRTRLGQYTDFDLRLANCREF